MLVQKLHDARKEAMKTKNNEAKAILSVLLSDAQVRAKIDQLINLTDKNVSDAAKYLIKQNRKLIDLLNTKYRQDIDNEDAIRHNLGITTEKDIILDEIEILEEYLVRQLTEEDVYEILLTVPLFSNDAKTFYTFNNAPLNNLKQQAMRMLKLYFTENNLDTDMGMVSNTVDKFIRDFPRKE